MDLDLETIQSVYGVAPGPVIHAGASLVQERSKYKSSGFEPVIWVEALPDIVERAKGLLVDYPRQDILLATLFDIDDKIIDFNRASNEGQSSSILRMGIHKIIHSDVSEEVTERYLSKKLDTLISEYQFFEDFSLLVFDLQGAELQALKGSVTCLSKTKAVWIEVSTIKLYRRQALFKEVSKFLNERGFELVAHDLTDKNFMGDALFIKRNIVETTGLKILVPTSRQFDWKITRTRVLLLLRNLGVPVFLTRNPFKRA
jgi:FkbM family methyltransferase